MDVTLIVIGSARVERLGRVTYPSFRVANIYRRTILGLCRISGPLNTEESAQSLTAKNCENTNRYSNTDASWFRHRSQRFRHVSI